MILIPFNAWTSCSTVPSTFVLCTTTSVCDPGLYPRRILYKMKEVLTSNKYCVKNRY